MTKSSKTLLLVLGGAAVLGAGAAIYFVSKKPDQVEGKGSSPTLPPDTATKSATQIVATTEQLAQIANAAATMNLSTALKLSKQPPPNMGDVGGASL